MWKIFDLTLQFKDFLNTFRSKYAIEIKKVVEFTLKRRIDSIDGKSGFSYIKT